MSEQPQQTENVDIEKIKLGLEFKKIDVENAKLVLEKQKVCLEAITKLKDTLQYLNNTKDDHCLIKDSGIGEETTTWKGRELKEEEQKIWDATTLKLKQLIEGL